MNHETAINLQGMVVEVISHPEKITFEKGMQFEAEMANNQMVYPGVTKMMMTTRAARRQWMHRKLEAWIDGVEQ